MPQPTPTAPGPTPANLFNLDYRAEAARLGPPPTPITDIHTHINGERAARIYEEARTLYGVHRTFSMTQLTQADAVRRTLGDSIAFIAVPDYMSENPAHAHTQGFIDDITEWHARGSRICKFWCAPRGRDYGARFGHPDLLTLASDWRRRQMDHAASLGMMFMAHIADPDTWFATTYKDASVYGTKAQQYETLEQRLHEYPVPWILAHMGGCPEDLGFLSALLERHPNAYLDTSATKWMVRELSRHSASERVAFFRTWSGRILFGSDIVTHDEHLSPDPGAGDRAAQASSEDEAFDLYASRYWALRTLFETDSTGPSPIADPDLKLLHPDRHDDLSSPPLNGARLPLDLQHSLYSGAAANVVDAWTRSH